MSFTSLVRNRNWGFKGAVRLRYPLQEELLVIAFRSAGSDRANLFVDTATLEFTYLNTLEDDND